MPEIGTIAEMPSAASPALIGNPLDPYVPTAAKPWNARRVAHVYRRLGFGASLAQIQEGLQMSPSDLIDHLLNPASDLGPPDPPYWAGYTNADYAADPNMVFTHRDQLRRQWLSNMLTEGIQAKMALFWHNHFVTAINTVGCNSYFWDYFSMIHEYSFGNFRLFAREMGKNPAMLVYLNGNLNVAGQPNENYARELMELFTMGESNGYTQADIVEMARALTGWQSKDYLCTPAYFDNTKHDNNAKTIFGQTANYSFTTAHNLIFSARSEQVSKFISGKIYKNFVYQAIDPTVVAGLADELKSNNWELLPTLKTLYKSEHFFDERIISARIKNPVETLIPILKMAGADTAGPLPDNWWDAIGYWTYLLGQEMFNPPNVAGWPGYHAWINESTLASRWNFSSVTSYFLTQNDTLKENLRSLAQALTNDSNDPGLITSALVDFFTGQTLEPIHLQSAIINFKAGIPENYYQDGTWNLYWNEAPYQIVNLLYYLVKLPEFQLT
ncbi:MAG: DUF1800 domain-containing protein [Bacteroidota bacterium]